MAIRVGTDRGTVTIINVYNPCDSNSTLPHVDRILRGIPAEEHAIMLGDFNRHHPAWDKDRNAHLFTAANLELAQELLDLTGSHWLEMALPKDIPTLESTRTKNHTRPDNVFISYSLALGLVSCDTAPDRRPPCTDHIPICTDVSLEPARVPPVDRWNFKKMDEKVFRRVLKERLDNLGANRYPGGQEGLDARVSDLAEAVLKAVESSVPKLRLDPRLKRWWTPELTEFRREVRKLAGWAYKVRFNTLDSAHVAYRAARNKYTQAIRDAKQKHWEEFLETLDEDTLWTAASYINDDQGGGGRTRVPNLKYKRATGEEETAKDNETKSKVLLDSFFPPPPPHDDRPGPRAPQPVQDLPDLSLDDVLGAICNLKLHKAPGPDGLPAYVYIVGADLLAPYLLGIFNLSLKKGIYPSAWRHSRTVVLRNPGKPDYSAPKAYHPIALLNVVSKILSACVAKRLNTLAYKHAWIPAHHFGGRPGHTTTDALHLLVTKVKDAWARGEVASALFLDVKGAFPHADPNRLAENMRLLGVPRHYIRWTLAKLEGRTTCLTFDDFVSEILPILNGIDQGCPLSAIFYLFYNSPLVRIPRPSRREDCIAYIDDITLLTWGKTAEENNERLLDMMQRKGGALSWSKSHNSTFELDKTALIHFSCKKDLHRPALVIGSRTIPAVPSHTLLGVILDQSLRFREQCNKAVTKGLRWTSQLGRLARMSYGASPKIARRLYLSIAVPRFTYAADIWFNPIVPPSGSRARFQGSVGFARKLAVVQSTATRAILGAMRSTPIQHLDAFASLLPVPYLMNEACQRAAFRLVSAPNDHPLRKIVNRALVGRKSHITPMQRIFRYVKDIPYCIEQWSFKDCDKPHLLVPSGYFPSTAAALMAARTDHARTKIYTDGSRGKEGVGAAAVLRVYDITRMRTGARLGDQRQCTVLEAELAGILCATKILARLRVIDDAVIYSDSQLAIACVEGAAFGAPKHLLSAIRSALDNLRSRKDCISLFLRWCPAHRDIVGNRLADHEAKVAARGESYPHDLVPALLVNYHPQINRLTAKDLVKSDNRIFAMENWESSSAGGKLLSRYPAIRPEDFLRNTAKLPRSHATLLFRLITGHVQLWRHLHKMRLVDSPVCQGCGRAQESVIHYLLRCPKYEDIRQEVLVSKGRDYLSISFLLSDASAFPALFDFIRRTFRFSDLIN